MKTILKTLLYPIVILVYITLSDKILTVLSKKTQFNIFTYTLYLIIFSIFLGLILGIEDFIKILLTKGKIKLNIDKIILLTILLIIILNYILVSLGLYKRILFIQSFNFIALCSIFFGNTITKLFKK